MCALLTSDTKATLLLCGTLRQQRTGTGTSTGTQPLSLHEYNALVLWLAKTSLRPHHLLDKAHSAEAAEGAQLDPVRLQALLERGAQLAFAVEEWQRDGLWVLSRSDADYPQRYKEHLGALCPPLLFGAGDHSLLQGGGLAILGSRKTDAHAAAFVKDVVALCAQHTVPVLSGGAQGIESLAMQAALCNDTGTQVGMGMGMGAGVCILADNLLRKSVERTARTAISEGRLLLISPSHPSAPSSTASATERNKLIYALADYALVVSTEQNKRNTGGDTWSGAAEELTRSNDIPVFVHSPSASHTTIPLGALSWPHDMKKRLEKDDMRTVLSAACSLTTGSAPVISPAPSPVDTPILAPASTVAQDERTLPQEPEETSREKREKEAGDTKENSKETQTSSIYHAVIPIIMCALEHACTADDMAKQLDVNKTQLNAWLKRAMDEKKIVKLSKPTRYQRAPALEQGRLTGC